MSNIDSIDSIFKKFKYLVINENENCKLYVSLRDIAKDISVDFTTISKKLKISPESCICRSKTTKESFYIKKL